MKLFHLSDLHLGKKVNEFSMLQDQEYILTEILRLAIEHKIDGIIIAGDIYDKAIPPVDAVQLLDRFLNQLVDHQIACYIISGNHDSNERLSFASNLLKNQNIHISTQYHGTLEPLSLQDAYGTIHLYLLPFIKPAYIKRFYPDETIDTYQDAIDTIFSHTSIDTTKRNLLVAHQFILGATRCESEDISIGGLDQISTTSLQPFDYVALGHIHSPQWLIKDNIRYSGTPLKYSFSEVNHQKSITCITIKEKGNLQFEFLPLKPKRELQEIKGSYMELTMKSFYETLNTQNYFHITLTDEEDIFDAIGKLRTIYPNIMRLDYDNKRTQLHQTITIDETVEKQSPFEQLETFYELQNNQPLSSKQVQYCQAIMEELWENQK